MANSETEEGQAVLTEIEVDKQEEKSRIKKKKAPEEKGRMNKGSSGPEARQPSTTQIQRKESTER